MRIKLQMILAFQVEPINNKTSHDQDLVFMTMKLAVFMSVGRFLYLFLCLDHLFYLSIGFWWILLSIVFVQL